MLGDRRISEPSAVCISISLPMYDPQKLLTAGFPHKKAAMHLELWLEHIELVGGFSPTHLKKYAQSSNWITFPQKNTCWNNKKSNHHLSQWWSLVHHDGAVLSYRNLPIETAFKFLQSETGHIVTSFSAAPPQASASQSMKQGIGTSINSSNSKAEVRES